LLRERLAAPRPARRRRRARRQDGDCNATWLRPFALFALNVNQDSEPDLGASRQSPPDDGPQQMRPARVDSDGIGTIISRPEEPPMSRIFVSYSRDNQGIVRRLVEDVEALGHVVWFDEELSGGQIWWDEVLNQIRNCEVFVLAVSPATLASTACKREYGYADDVGKPILPIVVSEGVSTNLLPPALSKVQLVTYIRQDRGEALRLARAIASLPPADPLPNPLPPAPQVPVSYLGQLTEKIESLSPLAYDEQSALLFDLRRSIQDPETRDDSRTLLERFRKRRDLFAAIAEEIDLVVGTAPRPAPPMAAAPAAVSAPRMAPDRSSASFEAPLSIPSIPSIPFEPRQPAAPPRAEPGPMSVSSRSSLNIPLLILVIFIGPIGWMIALRRSRRDVITVIVVTPIIYLLAGVFFASGDGIDGYSDDMWEYIGMMLLFATWWWPFARSSFRSKVLHEHQIDVALT
jgi:hypothetical protein